MELKTASSVMNYISSIEARSADWYIKHAPNHTDLDNLFTTFAGENKKFGRRLIKAYYSGVTDALETNFSFQGLAATVEIPKSIVSANPAELLTLSLELEKRIQSFYLQAANLSRDLLADLPRAMDRVVRAREKRVDDLQAKLQQL